MVDKVATVVTENLDAIALELRETGELGTLLAKAAAGQPLDAAERRKVKEQLIDVAKAVPALAIFAAPGGMVLLPLLAKLLPFDVLPSSFSQKSRDAARKEKRRRTRRPQGAPEAAVSHAHRLPRHAGLRRPGPRRAGRGRPRRSPSSWPSPTGRPGAARSCASRPPRPGPGSATSRCSSPTKVRDGALAAAARRPRARTLLVVVAYGRILGEDLLGLAPHGAVNVHASLLPRWRGAAPIQWAIAEGERETGVTIMQMDAGLDTGDILLPARPRHRPTTTPRPSPRAWPRWAARRSARRSALLEAGALVPVRQDAAKATLAPVLEKEHGRLDFRLPAARAGRPDARLHALAGRVHHPRRQGAQGPRRRRPRRRRGGSTRAPPAPSPAASWWAAARASRCSSPRSSWRGSGACPASRLPQGAPAARKARSSDSERPRRSPSRSCAGSRRAAPTPPARSTPPSTRPAPSTRARSALATELVYGTLRRALSLDAALAPHSLARPRPARPGRARGAAAGRLPAPLPRARRPTRRWARRSRSPSGATTAAPPATSTRCCAPSRGRRLAPPPRRWPTDPVGHLAAAEALPALARRGVGGLARRRSEALLAGRRHEPAGAALLRSPRRDELLAAALGGAGSRPAPPRARPTASRWAAARWRRWRRAAGGHPVPGAGRGGPARHPLRRRPPPRPEARVLDACAAPGRQGLPPRRAARPGLGGGGGGDPPAQGRRAAAARRSGAASPVQGDLRRRLEAHPRRSSRAASTPCWSTRPAPGSARCAATPS